MTAAFSGMIDPDLAMTFLIVDFPRADRCDPSDWECTIQAALGTRANTGGNVAMVATLPELMPEEVAERLIAGGVVPMNGLTEAIAAAEAAKARVMPDLDLDLVIPPALRDSATLTEAEAKAELAGFGLRTPKRARATNAEAAAGEAEKMGFPVVLKGEGFAHKSEAGAVVVGLESGDAVKAAAEKMGANSFLVEEMVTDGVAELLIGVVKDPAHGFVLTVGAGGILTEVMADSASCLIPASDETLNQCLNKLKVVKLLDGFRGKPAADRVAILKAIHAIQDYVIANTGTVEEVEVNPLICTPDTAVAVDALIRRAK